MNTSKKIIWLLCLALPCLLLLSGCTVSSQATGQTVNLQFGGPTGDRELAQSLQIVILLTGLTLIPLFLIITTAFVRIVVVLSVLRTAIGVPQLPPNQVIIGLALILTFFVMQPVWSQVNTQALQPFLDGKADEQTAVQRGMAPLREFMMKQVRPEDLALFTKLGGLPPPNDPADVPNQVLIPAFVISELRTAFQMAFVMFVPFLVIDMVVSTALLSMGMMMLPPTVVSLPFKLLLFVLVDGWHMIAQSLILSFHT